MNHNFFVVYWMSTTTPETSEQTREEMEHNLLILQIDFGKASNHGWIAVD
jgi:hypothetical protein